MNHYRYPSDPASYPSANTHLHSYILLPVTHYFEKSLPFVPAFNR